MVQLHTALQSAVYYKQKLAVAEATDHLGTEGDQWTMLRTLRRRTAVHTEGSWSLRDSCCNIICFEPRRWYQFSVMYVSLGSRTSVMHFLT